MKKPIMEILGWGIVVSLAFAAGGAVERHYYRDHEASKVSLIECYRSYAISAEGLLDSLENKYHWVDAFDYDCYYESVAEIFYLDSIGLRREKERQEYCFEMNKKFNK